jgi:molybdopterin synthase catalytic subunit
VKKPNQNFRSGRGGVQLFVGVVRVKREKKKKFALKLRYKYNRALRGLLLRENSEQQQKKTTGFLGFHRPPGC